jgi:hypothetical protein
MSASGRAIAGTLVAAAVVVLGVSAACARIRGPGATVRAFYRAVERGDIDAAVQHLSSRFVEQFGFAKIRKVLGEKALEIEKKGGIKSFTIDREDAVGDVGEVVVTVEYGNGDKFTETVKLMKERGEWKIQSPK